MIDQYSFSQFKDLVQTQLAQPLPGQKVQFQMAPLARQQPEMASVQSKTCKEAAVLALFYPCSKGRAKLLLTVRPDGMTKHAGQVAFPGGRREPGESLSDTALRETKEEIFVFPQAIELVGELTPLYIPPSNFCVFPFIGFVEERPDMSVTSHEVAAMFGVRAHELILPEKRSFFKSNFNGKERNIPFFDFSGYQIWGATAMMMAELAAVVDPSLRTLQPFIEG